MNKKRILIIEDSFTSFLIFEETLKMEGYETQPVATVKEAIEFINEKVPDLIILDLKIPEISGYDFLEMRGKLKIENIPVIVVSALDSPESIQKTLDLGASEFIPKPVSLNLLIEKVESLIKK